MDGWTDGQFIKFWAPCTAPWCLGHTYVLILQQLTHFLSSVIFLFPLSVLLSLSLSPVPLGTPFLPVLCQLVIKVWRNRKNREIGPALGRLEYDKTVLPQARGGWRKPGVRGGGKAS
jgi:hypothetical protein